MHTDLNGFTKIPKKTYPREKNAPPYKSATDPLETETLVAEALVVVNSCALF